MAWPVKKIKTLLAFRKFKTLTESNPPRPTCIHKRLTATPVRQPLLLLAAVFLGHVLLAQQTTATAPPAPATVLGFEVASIKPNAGCTLMQPCNVM
jgi:malonyl CoA-acyl carrier protein transacylase